MKFGLLICLIIGLAGCSSARLVSVEKDGWFDLTGFTGFAYCRANTDEKSGEAFPVCYTPAVKYQPEKRFLKP